MKTALYDTHVALGAKMVSFGGWEMPLQYKGIIPEHTAVREKVGLFDVSHMGRVVIEGKDAEELLDYLSTNRIAGKENFSATYTVWSNEEGGCVDDLIVYRENKEHFFVVLNAANRQKDLEHLKRVAQGFDVCIQDRFSEDGILALQGPNAQALIEPLFLEAKFLSNMRFTPVSYHGKRLLLARTGYTGSGGFEIYGPNESIVEIWDYLINEGDQYGLMPVGLGARDTLRLEMGYALYGHELSDSISASESVSGWTIKWDKKNFIGKSALEALENNPQKRAQFGIMLLDKGIAREGYEVFKNGESIGRVTSGTYAPTLDRAIAIILTQEKLSMGDIVEVQIRQSLAKAKVVSLPFYKPHQNIEETIE